MNLKARYMGHFHGFQMARWQTCPSQGLAASNLPSSKADASGCLCGCNQEVPEPPGRVAAGLSTHQRWQVRVPREPWLSLWPCLASAENSYFFQNQKWRKNSQSKSTLQMQGRGRCSPEEGEIDWVSLADTQQNPTTLSFEVDPQTSSESVPRHSMKTAHQALLIPHQSSWHMERSHHSTEKGSQLSGCDCLIYSRLSPVLVLSQNHTWPCGKNGNTPHR